MTYPRPLSDKNLEKKYEEAHITKEIRQFLHEFFAACANLYGAIELNDMWQTYRDLKDQFPMIHKTDMVRFSMIVRREDQPYSIYKYDELYDAEDYKGFKNWLIHKDLVGYASMKLILYYKLINARGDRPYYVPQDLLSYAQTGYTKDDCKLLDYLGCFVSVKDFNVYGFQNENKGKTLGEFSFLTKSDVREIGRLRDDDARVAAVYEKTKVSAAEKIIKNIILNNNVGAMPPSMLFWSTLIDIADQGVVIDSTQRKDLLRRVAYHYNNSRLWWLGGWTPNELHLSFERMHEAMLSGLQL